MVTSFTGCQSITQIKGNLHFSPFFTPHSLHHRHRNRFVRTHIWDVNSVMMDRSPNSPPRAMMDGIAAMAKTNGVSPHCASILKPSLDNCLILSFITQRPSGNRLELPNQMASWLWYTSIHVNTCHFNPTLSMHYFTCMWLIFSEC